MRRRDFIAGLGSVAAWPMVARAQERELVKRVVWIGADAEVAVPFGRELTRLGWIEGRNVRVDYVVGSEDRRVRATAPEIIGATPDLIVTVGNGNTQIYRQLTDTIPILFSSVSDPVGRGLVASYTRPGGNVTGFTNYEPSLAGKWLSILKEFVPTITNVMMLYEPANSGWRGFLPVLEAAAFSLGVTVRPAPAIETADVVRYIETLARDTNAGMIVTPTALTVGETNPIVALAARHRLPAICAFRFIAARGGLVSYGADGEDLQRRTAQYADRILKGDKPADLPVQAPTKFELVVNAKTARAMGLTIPPTLLALADEVIE